MSGNYPLRYRAETRRGGYEGGSTVTLTPDALAYALWKKGCKTAIITRDGEEVGAVGMKDGKRTWWGEK